jgi:hypothetical protein
MVVARYERRRRGRLVAPGVVARGSHDIKTNQAREAGDRRMISENHTVTVVFRPFGAHGIFSRVLTPGLRPGLLLCRSLRELVAQTAPSLQGATDH